jgi:hypothetical protein
MGNRINTVIFLSDVIITKIQVTGGTADGATFIGSC